MYINNYICDSNHSPSLFEPREELFQMSPSILSQEYEYIQIQTTQNKLQTLPTVIKYVYVTHYLYNRGVTTENIWTKINRHITYIYGWQLKMKLINLFELLNFIYHQWYFPSHIYIPPVIPIVWYYKTPPCQVLLLTHQTTTL